MESHEGISEKARGSPYRSIGRRNRRLGEYGPAYEIMSVDDTGNVVIEVIESGEQVKFPVAEVLADPMAETIP